VQLSLFAEETPEPEVAGVPEPALESPAEEIGGDAPVPAPAPARAPRRLPARLSEAVAEYLEYLVAMNRARHTRESFALDLKLLQQYLGDVALTTIGERELRSFVSHVRLERQNTATSVRRKVASVKNFFAYLQRERAIPADPALRLIYPEIFPALPEFLEDAQVVALLAAAADHHAWEALLVLMLETGLKRDEVVALGRTDVVLAPEGFGESYLVVRETERAKRLRSRRLEIGAEASETLRTYLRDTAPRDRFFDFSPRGVNFVVETCGRRARIVTRGPRLTPQNLRETFAMRRMRQLASQEDLQRAAGLGGEELAALMERHEDPESARKYRKLVRGWQDQAYPPVASGGPAAPVEMFD
jgi:site-specific recombinase XerD